MKVLRVFGIAAAVLLVALLITLAIPVATWRTGDQQLSPLIFSPDENTPDIPHRLWIDTDAACGHGSRVDPDDCLAIALLARTSGFQIVGISTVFGNAPRHVVDRTTRQLVAELAAEIDPTPPVFSGSSGPLIEDMPSRRIPAHEGLAAALQEGPLTVIALGPLTNLAAVLRARPALASRVARLVAVMARRPGHIFHPAEGADAGTFFGHGPVFRDFNFVMDMNAASQIVALNLPLSLIPYDAARGVEITASDLDRLAKSGGSSSWIAQRAREWLAYWREDVGRQGFYPFDLLAAAYVVEPSQFRCAPVRVWVAEDPTLFIPFWRPTALMVGQDEVRIEKARVIGSASYCMRAAAWLKAGVMDTLTATTTRVGDK